MPAQFTFAAERQTNIWFLAVDTYRVHFNSTMLNYMENLQQTEMRALVWNSN